MTENKRLIELLEKSTGSGLDDDELEAVEKFSEAFGQLDDHVLVEVTRFAVGTCAFRLAVKEDTDVQPTVEVFKQAIGDVLKLIQKSVDDDS